MATSADLTGAKTLMEKAMAELQQAITLGMTERGKVATGETLRSVSHEVNSYENIQGNTFGVVGRLSANDNWRFVGNGRGPGAPPPITTIERWMQAKGLSLNAWAVANKIGKQGSRDFRLKRPNVFEEEISGWQSESETLVAAANAIADALAQTVVVDLQTGLR